MNLIQSQQNTFFKHIYKLLNAQTIRAEKKQSILEGMHLLDAWLKHEESTHIQSIDYIIISHNLYQCIIEKKTIPITLITKLNLNQLIKQYILDIIAEQENNKQTKLIVLDDALWSKLTYLPINDVMTIIRKPEYYIWQNTKIYTDTQQDVLKHNGVILDNIQDSGNMGSIIRTAAAANYKWILMLGGAQAYSPKVLRAAMGGHVCLNIYQAKINDMQAIQEYIATMQKLYKHQLLLTSLQATNNIYNTQLNTPHIWLFGNEGNGVNKTWYKHKDVFTVSIPQNNAIESLNAAHAAALCLYENVRRNLI